MPMPMPLTMPIPMLLSIPMLLLMGSPANAAAVPAVEELMGGTERGCATNGAVFGCSLDPTGLCLAMDAATGAILWQYATGGSNGSGVSVFNGRVYVGVGYGALDPYIPLGNSTGQKVLVFSLPNQPADPPVSGGGGDD